LETKGNQLNNLNEDSKIMFFVGTSKEEAYTADTEDGNRIDFDYFTLTSDVKKMILSAVASARAESLLSPYAVLVPQKMFDKAPKNFTYPIPFLGERIYVVPWIRGILVYEFD